MTSTPVKNVSQLLNFVEGKNLTKTGGMNLTDSFGDVMSRAKSGGSGSQSIASKQAGQKVTAINNRRETVKTEVSSKESVKVENVTAQQKQALEEAGKEVVKEVAKELGVTQEEVEKAMEDLGLSPYLLLDPANLTQLTLQLSGEQDATVLLTDGNLFAKLQALLEATAKVKAAFMQEMDIRPEDMQALLDAVQEEGLQTGVVSEERIVMADEMTQESLPQVTVEVKSGDENIKLATDEKGNVTGTVEVISSNTEESITDQYADPQNKDSSEGKKDQSEGAMHTGNQMIDALLQDKVQAEEVTFEQTAAHFSEQTQDIMNQIMDYMKIQLKPGMDQLEMQLHPASLGTVHVQLSTKGGEVTAQFQVQNETVKAAIESQIVTLQESLKDQGVKVQAVQVTVENHGFESNLWQGQGREENASSQNGKKTPRRINLNELDELFGEEVSEDDLLTAKMMEANGNSVDYTV